MHNLILYSLLFLGASVKLRTQFALLHDYLRGTFRHGGCSHRSSLRVTRVLGSLCLVSYVACLVWCLRLPVLLTVCVGTCVGNALAHTVVIGGRILCCCAFAHSFFFWLSLAPSLIMVRSHPAPPASHAFSGCTAASRLRGCTHTRTHFSRMHMLVAHYFGGCLSPVPCLASNSLVSPLANAFVHSSTLATSSVAERFPLAPRRRRRATPLDQCSLPSFCLSSLVPVRSICVVCLQGVWYLRCV